MASTSNFFKNVIDDKTVRFLFLPEGYDPDSFVKEKGEQEFYKKLDRAMVLESFAFQYLKRGKKLDSPEDIRQIIFEFKKLLPLKSYIRNIERNSLWF